MYFWSVKFQGICFRNFATEQLAIDSIAFTYKHVKELTVIAPRKDHHRSY